MDGNGDLLSRSNASGSRVLLSDPLGDGDCAGGSVDVGVEWCSGATGTAGCHSIPQQGVTGTCGNAPSDGGGAATER